MMEKDWQGVGGGEDTFCCLTEFLCLLLSVERIHSEKGNKFTLKHTESSQEAIIY